MHGNTSADSEQVFHCYYIIERDSEDRCHGPAAHPNELAELRIVSCSVTRHQLTREGLVITSDVRVINGRGPAGDSGAKVVNSRSSARLCTTNSLSSYPCHSNCHAIDQFRPCVEYDNALDNAREPWFLTLCSFSLLVFEA